MKWRFLTLLLLFVAGVGLFGGLGSLIHLRFKTGHSYPVQSSLRSDPMGSKALHDAYLDLPSVSVERSFAPIDQVQDYSTDATMLMLNVWGWQMHSLADYDVIDRFVKDGGRLLIALNSERVAYEHLEDERAPTEDIKSKDSKETPAEKGTFTRVPHGDQAQFWSGLCLTHGEHTSGDAELVDGRNTSLAERLPWREGGALAEFDESIWQPIYQLGEDVVAAERVYGAGRIIVLTDDYLFSNEALLQHRYGSLLAWAVGDKSHVIFEESHLGVTERTGVAVLMRRYRLHALMLSFACFMGLVLWRGACPLLPAFSGTARGNVVRTEHSTEAGLGDLVRRSVPSARLPVEAFRCWKKTFIRSDADARHYRSELEEAEAVLAEYEQSKSKKVYETHSKIKSIIQRKKRRRL